MKTKLNNLLLIPFFALLLFTSCQEEKVEITDPNESETLVATSELTNLMLSTSIMDGSADNIIDNASCLSVDLPVTVKIKGIEIIIDSKEDFKVIETIFDEFDDDIDKLDIVFPITIILADHSEIVLNNSEALEELIKECKGENETDDDIECIDFQYPISFSVFDTEFQIIDNVSIESDRQLYRFIKRVKNAEVIASLNFPIVMVLADGSTVEVNNNEELHNTIKDAKDTCDEDDDNDHNDDDFTKERLDEYLKTCPWVVYEFKRNQEDLNDKYGEYVMIFKEDNVVKVRDRNGGMLTGIWITRVTDKGALIKLEFDTLVDFTLEWVVYDLESGKIKFYKDGGNKIILKKNCDIVVDITKERVKNYLKECLWRITRLNIDNSDREKDYIGTPLSFFDDNTVKIRVNGELIKGTYEINVANAGIVLRITLDGRPDLKLEWLVSFLEEDLIKLENQDNKMVLQRHCPGSDGDLGFADDVLTTNDWKIVTYIDEDVNKTAEFVDYSIDFMENGHVKVTNNLNDIIDGSWLAYRDSSLFLGMHFGTQAPFDDLSDRWRITEVTQGSIELIDYDANGGIKRILVLEKEL